MDYKVLVDNFKRLACVLSVDLKETESNNKYFVVDANEAYMHSVGKTVEDFECNVPYTRYIPKAANFETLCDDCVNKNRPVHTYFDIELYNAWMEVFLIPLESDDPDKGMLLFTYEMNPKADIDKLTDISSETAANVLKTCLMLRETEDFQEAMNAVVADIREQCGAKRCSILLTDYERREYKLLSEDYGNDPNQKPLSAFLTEEFYKVIETWPRLIQKSNCFAMENEQDLIDAHKIAPEWIDSLRGDNVKTLVIYPLRSDNKTIGYIWAGNFDPSKTQMIKETLGLTAFILSAEIANEQNARKMKIMSSTDLLTGVFNRNAMNNRITEDTTGVNPIKKPFGVCFIDVNGLKAINDSRGHLEGDHLLVDVASTLKEFSSTNGAEIYRVGGDEFMIITPDMSREDFEKYAQTLRDNCERPDRAHFALGACHSDDAEGGDVRKAMQKADALMYKIKAEYYKRHPDMEWHNKIS